MPEPEPAPAPAPAPETRHRRRPHAGAVAAVVVSLGSLGGSLYLSIDGEGLAALVRALTGTESGAAVSDPAAAPAVGIGGGIHWQGSHNNTYLYNNAFRVEVVRRTGDVPAANRELRDKLLAVIEDLVGELDRDRAAPHALQRLGERLGAIIEETPVSAYQLTGRQFTLAPGAAYFLPGGSNSLAYLGPATDGDPDEIAVMRDGRRVSMRIGSIRVFTQGDRTCRLVLHALARDRATATFSYTCGES
ncbi:MAG: hypothetical protein ACFCUO_00690 [Rhodospirillales bacterium]